jgi:hypothetical protein
MKKIFYCGLILSIGFSSCDKVKMPYVKGSAGSTDTTGSNIRKVLIEDFTGAKCGNCPTAAVTINTIKGIHPGKVISIAVHADFYAIPGAAPYTYDFRTTPGNDYDVFFQPPSFPNGMINRKDYPSGGHWKSVSSWASIVDTLLALPSDASIEITNNYNSTTRNLTTNVKTKFLNPLNGTYKLMVALTEDSIVKPQTDYSQPAGQQDVLNYIHRHVLRDAITSTSWGDSVATGLIAAGDSITKTYNYTLPATYPATNGIAPNENLCYVIAYIYNAATYEVIQVEEKKIK